jgi:hypothetical protein
VWAPLTCEPADIYTRSTYNVDDVASVLPPSLVEYLQFLSHYLPVEWQAGLAAQTITVQPIQVGPWARWLCVLGLSAGAGPEGVALLHSGC